MNVDARIYVAGHTGLVGSAIVRCLKASGYTNIITRSRSELNLESQEQTNEFFKRNKPEYVFLAAAKVGGILANSLHQGDFIYENIAISTNVIYAAKQHGVKKLLNLGSSCIYPRESPQPIKESYLMTGLLEPTNEGYAVAKIAALKMCRYFNEQFGTNFLSVMPTNLFGQGDSYNLLHSHVLPAMLRKFHLGKLLIQKDEEAIDLDIRRNECKENINADWRNKFLVDNGIEGESITFWGSGKPRREFLYVDDLAEAVVYLIKEKNASEIGEVINIGTGKDCTLKELAELISEIVGYTGEIRWDVSKPDGMPQKLLDVTIMKSLGLEPKHSLYDGVVVSYKCYINGN